VATTGAFLLQYSHVWAWPKFRYQMLFLPEIRVSAKKVWLQAQDVFFSKGEKKGITCAFHIRLLAGTLPSAKAYRDQLLAHVEVNLPF